MSALSDRTFIVTGAGGAIAGAIVRSLADAGARLMLVDRHEDHVRARAKEHGGLAVAADLTTSAGAMEMAGRAKAMDGRIDGLVHTVGAFAWGPLHEATDEVYDRMFDANVRTLFNAVRAVLPEMLARNSGFIAGIASEPAWTGAAKGSALYAAAKSAVATLLRSLDAELSGSAIRVAVLYPMGVVDTPANRKDMPDADPAGFIDPAELAAAIRFAAERGPRGRVTELPVYPAR